MPGGACTPQHRVGARHRSNARTRPRRSQGYVDIAAGYGLLSGAELARLSVVECDLTREESVARALQGVAQVVCAVGASDGEFSDLSAPRRIDGEGAARLVEAAAAANVSQFVLVTSLGTGKVGFPAAILNLFGGVLIFKRQAEVALEASGLPYVIVRPGARGRSLPPFERLGVCALPPRPSPPHPAGGMERPRDDFKRTHNVQLATRDTLFGGQVSRLQVAELIAAAVANPQLADNKVLEVVADASAPCAEYETLLLAHPAGARGSDAVHRALPLGQAVTSS